MTREENRLRALVSSLQAKVDSYEIENQDLLDQVMLLKNELAPVGWLAPLEFRLTPKEALILNVLMHNPVCTKERLHAAVSVNKISSDEETEIKIVDVFVCKVRAKLKPFDVEIETHWGTGYSLSAASKNIIQEMLQ